MIFNRFINRHFTFGIVLIASLSGLMGCAKDSEIPSVDHLDGSFRTFRFDQDLHALDTTVSNTQLTKLKDKYPLFWDLYFEQILALTPPQGSDSLDDSAVVQDILRNKRMAFLLDTVSVEFADFTPFEEELSKAFQYYQYHFPGNRVPHVYTLISDFAYFPFIFEDEDRDGIGISLEMFMGANFPYRAFTGKHPGFSDYLTRSFNKAHLTRRVIEVMVDDILGPPPGDRLLDLMIHNGKKLYLIEQMLPESPDSVLFDFTANQVAWCEANERNVWAHFLTEDLLYSNRFDQINKLVNYSPNVPGMPPEAPGRIANWTGWHIVHAWKDRAPGLTAIDIVATRDAQRILEEARYKPK